MNIEELKKRAEAGDTEAMCDLALAYFNGEGVEMSVETTVELLQAAVERGDDYAPYLLGQIYINGHVDDEECGYKGMRFLGIAARRGFKAAGNEIAEHRLGFTKSLFEAVFAGVDSSLCPPDFLDYARGAVDAFIVHCRERNVARPEEFNWLSWSNHHPCFFFLEGRCGTPPTVKNRNFRDYLLANMLIASVDEEQCDTPVKAAILCKAAELVRGIDAAWVASVLSLAYYKLGEICISAGDFAKAAQLYTLYATNNYICYLSQLDEEDVDYENISQEEYNRIYDGEEDYYNAMLRLTYALFKMDDVPEDALQPQEVLEKLCEVQRTQLERTGVVDDWLTEQLNAAVKTNGYSTGIDKEVNIVNLLRGDFFGYFMVPYMRVFYDMTAEWNGETLNGEWDRDRFELIELVMRSMPSYFDEDEDSRAYWMMVLHKFRAQYYMLTNRPKLVEKEFFEAMALFDEAAADERDAAVEQYVMCLQCLWSFYRVQGMQRDKREAMLSRLDVLLPHERAWPKDFEKGIRYDN